MREASGKAVKPGKADSVKLSFPQPVEIISIMQDALDGGKGGSGSSIDQDLLQQYIQAGDGEDEEEDDEEDAGMQISAPSPMRMRRTARRTRTRTRTGSSTSP